MHGISTASGAIMSSDNDKKRGNGPLERQAPLSDTLKLIYEEMMIPGRTHKDPKAASSKARPAREPSRKPRPDLG